MKADKQRCFVDTNVLLCATDNSRACHDEALAFLDEGMTGQRTLYVSNQVLREYMVVATRPVEGNGLGMSSAEAIANVHQFRKCVTPLPEDAETSTILLRLIEQFGITGKRIHDANIVAVMWQHGLKCLKTYNPSDFAGFNNLVLE